MDVVYGFNAKIFRGARKNHQIFALVIVCLHTSATNILAMEAVDTQSVVNAIERHACRYGMPAEAYVDNGSQLAKVEDFTYTIRSVDMQLYDSRGIRVFLSTPKSHEGRGRVENKVKLLRESLQARAVSQEIPLTPLQWETVFAMVSNSLDDVPIAKTNSSNVSDPLFDLITPNKLKMGRNNYRSIHGGGKFSDVTLPSALLDKNRKIFSAFYSIMLDRLHYLQAKPQKWLKSADRQPLLNDLVIFVFTETKMKTDWKLGRVINTTPREITIRYTTRSNPKAQPTYNTVKRSPRQVVIVFSENDVPVNSNEYFKAVLPATLTTNVIS